MLRKVCIILQQIVLRLADEWTVRTTRSRIIYLRNDYKDLMNVIEKHIHEHFARQAENGTNDEPLTTVGAPSLSRPASSIPTTSLPLGPAFAKVNSVVERSPADAAGLKAGDEIRNFGYVNHTNHDGLRRVGECVQGNEGVSVFAQALTVVADISSLMFW